MVKDQRGLEAGKEDLNLIYQDAAWKATLLSAEQARHVMSPCIKHQAERAGRILDMEGDNSLNRDFLVL